MPPGGHVQHSNIRAVLDPRTAQPVQIARPQSCVNAAILAWFHRHIDRIGDADDLQRGSVQFRAGHLNLDNDESNPDASGGSRDRVLTRLELQG